MTAECLNLDLKLGKGQSSTCRPLADGAPCGGSGGGKTCAAGICGGRAAFNAEQDAAAEAKAEAKAGAAEAPEDKKKPAPPAPVRPVPAWANFTAAVFAGDKVRRVPETFLATSHEWDRIMDYADNIEAFTAIFKEFGPSPILRMGGASQDFLKEPPPKEIW